MSRRPPHAARRPVPSARRAFAFDTLEARSLASESIGMLLGFTAGASLITPVVSGEDGPKESSRIRAGEMGKAEEVKAVPIAFGRRGQVPDEGGFVTRPSRSPTVGRRAAPASTAPLLSLLPPREGQVPPSVPRLKMIPPAPPNNQSPAGRTPTGGAAIAPAASPIGPNAASQGPGVQQPDPSAGIAAAAASSRVGGKMTPMTAPVANDDSYSTPHDETLFVGPNGTNGVTAGPGQASPSSATITPNSTYLKSVLGNDTPYGSLTSYLVAAPSHGSLLYLNTGGQFQYVPNAHYAGTDSFTYKAYDGSSYSNVATVYINVTNSPPNANNDAYSMQPNTTLNVAAKGVLVNDSDPNGDALTAVLAVTAGHGALTLNGNGSFSYTPAAGYAGPDSFTYKANDGVVDSNVATVSITVNPDFTLSNIVSRRTAPSAYAEAHAYVVKSGEHFDNGSTFLFTLVDGIQPQVGMRWEIYDDGTLHDSLLASGTGNNFSYSFAAGLSGYRYVFFYYDTNGDGHWSSGEPSKTSATFWVQDRKSYVINVDVSSALPAGTAAQVSQRLQDASYVLLRKDNPDDYRAAVNFMLGTVNTFTATPSGGARPDPAVGSSDWQKHFDATADIVFVSDIQRGGGLPDDFLGITLTNWHEILIQWNSSPSDLALTIAHEMGHGVGLNDLAGSVNTGYVMFEFADPGNIMLHSSEADAYD